MSTWRVDPASNAALEEALQWKKGQLALEVNDYEVAQKDGRRYNVFGLAFVVISLIGTTLTQLGGGSTDAFHPPFYVLLVALPLVVAAFVALKTVTKSSAWGAFFAFFLIACTSLLPVLEQCGGPQGGSINFINQVLATTGLLIFGADLLGARRIWPAVLGLALTAWSRQMTMLYAIPMICIAWRSAGRTTDTANSNDPPLPQVPKRQRPFRTALVGLVFVFAVPLILNTLKFGNPIDSGYSRIYEGRTDPIGRRGHEALFSLKYLADGAKAMNYALPKPDIRKGSLFLDYSSVNGMSIWVTCPLLLGIFVTAPRWLRDCSRRALMIATIPIIFGLLCYHTTGANGAGHYRYALDFVPIWLLVIAPYLISRSALPWTLAATAYGALYFSLLP